MSDHIIFKGLPCQYSFQKMAGQTRLVLSPQGASSLNFGLEIPVEGGSQMDRLPLPTDYINEDLAAVVAQAASLNDFCRFPVWSIQVENPRAPGKASVWVQRL